MKLDTKLIDEIINKFIDAVPKDVKTARENLQKNLRASVEGVFQRLDLVTREEFDVQKELLVRSQEKIKSLEQRIRDLEKGTLGKS